MDSDFSQRALKPPPPTRRDAGGPCEVRICPIRAAARFKRRAAGYNGTTRLLGNDRVTTPTAGPDNDKVAAFARRWAGLVLTRRNDYVLKFD